MRLSIMLFFFVSNLFAQKIIYTITKTDNTQYKAETYNTKFKKFKFTTTDGQELEMAYNQLGSIEYFENRYKKLKPENITLKFIRFSERNGVLMKVLKEGKCNLYVHEFQYLHYYVLRKDEHIATPIYLKQTISNNFKKTALEYFKDCKKVTDKIKKKEFWKKNIPEMVEYYNSNCE
ncbi:hypothetical protein MHTCC0001_35280 [Flavobacteriaceae bacterium MHTCC 0001]